MYKDTLMVQIYIMRRLQHSLPDESKHYYLSILLKFVCCFIACFNTLKTRRWIILLACLFSLWRGFPPSVTPATVRGSVVTCCCLYVVLLKRDENNQRIF